MFAEAACSVRDVGFICVALVRAANYCECEHAAGVVTLLPRLPLSVCLQGISDGMSCAVNEARMAVDVGYWPLYRYTPETDLPTTTDEVSNTAGGRCCVDDCPCSQPLARAGHGVSVRPGVSGRACF